MMHHTNTLRRFSVVLGVCGMYMFWQSYKFVKERQQQELYHFQDGFFFHFLFHPILKSGDRNLPCLCDNVYFIVPNIWKSFAFGTVLHKIYLPLQM
jgi:hypothetical protein